MTLETWVKFLTEAVAYDPQSPMLFNSGLFLFFFSLFYFLYVFVYHNKRLRTLYVVAFSSFFYYKSSGWYLAILLTTVLVDYFIARHVAKRRKQKNTRLFVALSIVANLSLLLYFKYANFFLLDVGSLLGLRFSPLDLFLPIGISFYTFQSISYVVDAYKGQIEPAQSFWDYAFYMTFFPHLVAGPIVRAKDFLPQLSQKITIDREAAGTGLFLILKGLIKKAVFADYLAGFNDLVFSAPQQFSSLENWAAFYGYALQIYFDFSGYSDMAIGLAKLMGFTLLPNFDRPYTARNITEFWRKWHISLSHWLRDYIYIPLGGNRRGKTNLNLFATMLIGGFWHGASWNFIAWGALHGVALIADKAMKRPLPGKIGKIFAVFLTFHFVALMWLPFRISGTETLFVMLDRLVALDVSLHELAFFFEARTLRVFFALWGIGLCFVPQELCEEARIRFVRSPLPFKIAAFVLVIQIIVQLADQNVQPFIYFQF